MTEPLQLKGTPEQFASLDWALQLARVNLHARPALPDGVDRYDLEQVMDGHLSFFQEQLALERQAKMP